MESLLVRYRNLLVLLALLAAQILGLATQVRRSESGRNLYDAPDSKGVRLIRLWANAIVTPPHVWMHSSRLGGGDLWRSYIDLHDVRRQNNELQQTIDRLRLEQAMLLEDAKQGRRLQSMFGFQEKYIYKTVAAQVVGASGSDTSRLFTLDKGSAEGLEHDDAVITPDGIVGKIREVFPHSAQVLAINDQSSGAGVILEKTRIRGILRGNAVGQLQVMGILADQRIQPGERVLTAGGDAIYPRGLPVGVIEKVTRDPDRDAFILIRVKPAAAINSLDEVLVITSTQPRFAPKLEQDIAASEALKGAEAAAISAKMKTAAIMAERLPGLTEPAAQTAPGAKPQNGAQPGDPAKPAVAPAAALTLKAPAVLHPDRFSPVAQQTPQNSGDGKPAANAKTPQTKNNAAAKPETRPDAATAPKRNP